MERGLFYHELDDGCYTVWSYGLYKTMKNPRRHSSRHTQLIVHYGCGLQGNFFYDWMVYFAVGQWRCFSLRRRLGFQKHRRRQRCLTVYNVLQILFSGLLMREQQPQRLGVVATNLIRPIRVESANVEPFQRRFQNPPLIFLLLLLRHRGLLRRSGKSYPPLSFTTPVPSP